MDDCKEENLVLVSRTGKNIPIASLDVYDAFRVIKKEQSKRINAYDTDDLVAFAYGLNILRQYYAGMMNNAFKTYDECKQLWEENCENSVGVPAINFLTIYKDFKKPERGSWQISLDSNRGLQCALLNELNYIPTDKLYGEVVAIIISLGKTGVTKQMVKDELTLQGRTWSMPHFDCIVDAKSCQTELLKLQQMKPATPPPTDMKTPVAHRKLTEAERQDMRDSMARLERSRARGHDSLKRLQNAHSHEQLQDEEYERRELEFQAAILGPSTATEQDHLPVSGKYLSYETPARKLAISSGSSTGKYQDEITDLATNFGSAVTLNKTGSPSLAMSTVGNDGAFRSKESTDGTLKTSAESTSPTLSLSSISSTTTRSFTGTVSHHPMWNGMVNNGNMCYVTATVQALKTIVLRNPEALAGLTSQLDANGESSGLGYCLSQLMGFLGDGTDRAPVSGEVMAKFKEQVLKGCLPNFGNSEAQQDTAEFFGKLAETIYDQMMPPKIKQLEASAMEKANMVLAESVESQPMKLFMFVVETSFYCGNCGQQRSIGDSQQFDFSMNLPMDNCHDVSGMLDKVFRFEEIMMEDKYPCQCGYNIATKVCRMVEFPNVLSTVILRFNNSGQKLPESVAVPKELITPGGVYDLMACTTHHGDTIEQGHFTCDAIRPADGGVEWFSFDDENVSHSPNKDLGSAYQLFYQARTGSSAPLTWEQAKHHAMEYGKPLFVHVRNGFTCESQQVFLDKQVHALIHKHFVLWQGEWWEAMEFSKKYLEKEQLQQILPVVAVVDGNGEVSWGKSSKENWQSSPEELVEELKRCGKIPDSP